MKPQIQLILDSGAFSAWSLGKNINLKEYIEFCKKNEESIAQVVSLDVINRDLPEHAADAGRKNFLEMREAGVDAIPVFHAREKLDWLAKMCDDTNYVGLSGTSLVSPIEVKIFYDLCYQYITDKNGCPVVKTHLFGDTSPHSLLNYPAYSADSATWMIQAGRAARVNLDGKSYQLHSTKRRDTSYIDNSDTGPKRDSWEAAFRNLGIDPDKLMNIQATQSQKAMIRAYMVAAELLRLQARSCCCPRYKKPANLLNNKRQLEGGTARVGPCRCHFVISPSAWYFNFVILAALNVKYALVSYYYVADAPAKFWPERMMPFLYDPQGFCDREPKLQKYYHKLQEVLLKQDAVTA